MEHLGIQDIQGALGLKALQENPHYTAHLAPQGNIIHRHIMNLLHRRQLPLEAAGAIAVAENTGAVNWMEHGR